MGVVYKAEDTKLRRTVALKFLPQHLTSTTDDQARFLQEAQTAATLNHPNICIIHAIEEENNQQFIVMEYIEGENLKAHIKKGRLGIEQIIDISTRVAEGLKAAHEKGVVHRDIKSDNIMITKDGQVKIMDFGLAKLKGGAGLTRTGSTIGTIGYMAPEQIQGNEVNQQSDLWALGVVLYEMLAKKPPFRGDHEAAIMYEILNIEPQAVQSYRADVPDHLQLVVSQLLQKDPSRRFGSAAEVIERLKKPVSAPAASASEKSIAALYFENMSLEKDSEYFCAGMTEDIITDLSKIKELKVVSRTDVLPFRNKEVNTRQVGETLRVNYILEGSVRKAGNKIRITAQLIDVKTGFHVWAERYDRLIDDIFDLQDDIAQSIVKALKISLTELEKQSLGKKPTADLRAYDFYMRGRELLYKRGKMNNEAAIQMFENALSIDPNFSLAYAGLAEAYSYMYSWYDGEQKWLGKIIELNQKVLTLDPGSVEAQFGIGIVYFHQKRFGEAKRTLERVIQQKPDYYDAYRWLGIISDITDDYDSAIRYYERAAVIKPHSEEPWMHLDMTYRRKGDEKASLEAERQLLEVGSRKLEVNPEDGIPLSRMTTSYFRLGEKDKGYAALEKVLNMDPSDGVLRYNCACTYAMLGEKEKALTCLREALESGYKNVREWVKSDPDFETVREDEGYKALLAEYG